MMHEAKVDLSIAEAERWDPQVSGTGFAGKQLCAPFPFLLKWGGAFSAPQQDGRG